MATAARFSAGAGSLSGNRAKSAHRAAIFRLVVSSNGQVILLDYNTSAIDEMTNDAVVPAQRLRASRDPNAVSSHSARCERPFVIMGAGVYGPLLSQGRQRDYSRKKPK